MYYSVLLLFTSYSLYHFILYTHVFLYYMLVSALIYSLVTLNKRKSGLVLSQTLLIFFVVAGFIFHSSSTGKTFKTYVLNSTSEVKKVVWPNKKETSQMTLVVFVFVLLMGIFLWLIDSLLSWLIKILLGDY